jgi:hypothetical protein
VRFVLTLACLLLATGAPLLADQWVFFYPASVLSFGCTARQILAVPFGEHHGIELWEAEAYAVRTKDQGNWGMTIGKFPNSDKGRRQAEKECFRWMDQATKRVKAAK